MKPSFKTLILTLYLIGFGLFIWSILPNAKIMNTFTINPDFSLFSEKNKCEYIQEIMEAKYEISYPKTIHSDGFGEIEVIIESPVLNESKINNGIVIKNCGMSLEVWVDGQGMLIEPGNKIIEPYLKKQPLNFRFEIIPLEGQFIKGTIWINAVFYKEKDTGIERIPLFAIPYTIKIQSLSGMPVRTIRVMSISLIILSLLFRCLLQDQNKKRK
jgi:hypothetical protein